MARLRRRGSNSEVSIGSILSEWRRAFRTGVPLKPFEPRHPPARAVRPIHRPGDSVMMRLSLLSVCVKDQDVAIEFYTKKLGFLLAEDVPFGAQRWVTLRLPDDEVVSLTLKVASTDEELALVGRQGGSQPFFSIVTDDCVREYRRMKDAGVKFHGE